MLQKIKHFILYSIAVFFLASIILTLPLRWINPVLWSWQLQRDFSPPEQYQQRPASPWVNLDNISPYMQLAVIAGEDQKFPDHYGIDFQSTQEAIEDMIAGERFRGASTLTQQTVKNLFLWSGKDLIRKGLEAYLSLLIEVEWGKERILEVYLNVVEFGPGVFGVVDASHYYFGVAPSQLSAHQAASLASVLPNPYRFSVTQPSAYTKKRVAWIEKQMTQLSLGYLKKLK